MTDEQTNLDRDADGRHDFQSATIRAGDSEIVDDEGHTFTRGRVADRDEVDEQ